MAQKPRPLSTKVSELFGIDYPIIAAPMFLVSNEKMVTAASNAGGIGTFPALNFRPIENYRKAIQDIKKTTSKPFGINIIVQKSNKHQQEHIDIALEEEVPLIITSLGSPKGIIERVRGTKTKVFCDVIGLEHAKKCADYGANGLIAVGSGAGGHGGDISLFSLIPHLKKHVDLPLIAAGSISDGSGLLAALALGADAVYMGTRMIATHEAPASQDYKNAIIHSEADQIINTDRVDGFPGNFILTDSLKPLLQANIVDNILSQNKKVKRWISLLRASKALFGNHEQKISYKNVFSAGHGVSAIDKLKSVEEVIHDTMNEYYALVTKIQKL
ncbi:MAG: nitronate monooxygenase [Bdellovibrionaceae bacterium]|nr:nitronate monooxygenase [Pseudobdellovibrionaceae bacterium]